MPIELSREEHKELASEYVNDNFASQSMIADVAFHYNENNPHIHIMFTMRDISPEGFLNKNRSWNDRNNMEGWRESWALKVNEFLEKAKVNEKIDHKSFERQGKDPLPQKSWGSMFSYREKGN